MDVRKLPQEVIDKVRASFEDNKEVRQLRVKQQYFERQGRFAEALEIAKVLEELFTVVLDGYMQKAEHDAVRVNETVNELSDADREEMMEKMMVLFMCCDIIESAALDVNDVIKRADPNVDVTMFADMQKLSDMAKTKLKYFGKAGDYMNDALWGERCDNMYAMMLSKAKSIMRKRKDSKDWGKGFEEYGKENR